MRTSYYILLIVLLTSCISKEKIASLVKYEDKYGFIDKNGKWVIRPVFDSLSIFCNGYADCYRNNKNGKIDYKGKRIIGYKYDFIGTFENGLALVIIDDSVNYVDLKGKIKSLYNFCDGKDFSCGLAPVQLVEDGKWGYISTAGKLKSNTIFDYAGEFKDNKAVVEIGEVEYLIDTNFNVIDTIKTVKEIRKFPLIGNSNDNTLGKLNRLGDTIMAMTYKSFGYRQGDLFWFNNGIYYGLADTTGKILTDTRYEYLSYFSDNGLAIAKINGKFGFINKNGSVLIDFKFDDAQGFKYDFAAVKKNGKWGFINKYGEFVIEPKFDNIGHQFKSFFSDFEPMYIFEEE
jgi:hypothetical protein